MSGPSAAGVCATAPGPAAAAMACGKPCAAYGHGGASGLLAGQSAKTPSPVLKPPGADALDALTADAAMSTTPPWPSEATRKLGRQVGPHHAATAPSLVTSCGCVAARTAPRARPAVSPALPAAMCNCPVAL